MQNTNNIDGVRKIKDIGGARLQSSIKFLKVDSIVRRPAKKPVVRLVQKYQPVFVVPYTPTILPSASRKQFLKKIAAQTRVPVLAVVMALFLAFGGGMWAVWNTDNSAAQTQPQVLGAFTGQPSEQNQNTGSVIGGAQLQSQASAAVSNDTLFNTPIQYLQNYFNSINQPDVIYKRKNQLAEFLKAHNSPLAEASETIATQEHWKLILAIAFAESTLGKNCADNNCSNIGVKPGHALWRRYSSYSAWVVDFNRLLSKKYNDWTLEQMCGVYVQPCNANWLLATKQILTQLEEQGIE